MTGNRQILIKPNVDLSTLCMLTYGLLLIVEITEEWIMKYPVPAERYMHEPENQSCYEYMLESSARIKKDIGNYNAVICYGSVMKIDTLIAQADRLAGFFCSRGVKRGDVYVIFLPTSTHAFTAFYALNKIGAICYFIHPMTPPDALEKMMAATNAKGIVMLDMMAPMFMSVLEKHESVLCSPSDFGALPDTTGDKFASNPLIHRYCDIMKGEYPETPVVSGNGKDTAFYMNGGGTTGRSKTVMLSSYAINSGAYVTYLLDTPHEYGKCCSLAVLPCFHAFGLCDTMHYSICNAYTAICMPKFDARTANEIVTKYHVTHMIGVPNMFVKMFAEDNFLNPGLKNLDHLYAGGDSMNEAFREKFNAVLKENGCQSELTVGYGMTEMTAICTTNSHFFKKSGSIGYPYEGIKIKIVDDDGNELPTGEVGEVLASGCTMMDGYLPDDYIHESGIITDENGEKWVHSGDMGSLDEDGFLWFSGRKKKIIIISGYNVYPATIEEKVGALDNIREVCAVHGRDSNGKSLIKLCVSLKDSEIDLVRYKTELLEFCRENLESISVPRRIEILPALPRTKMDKIDFMALTEA